MHVAYLCLIPQLKLHFSAKPSSLLLAEHEKSRSAEPEKALLTIAAPPRAISSPSAPITTSLDGRLTKWFKMISQSFAQQHVQPVMISADMYKQQISYYGVAGLSSFLERVEKNRVRRGVPKASLLNSSVELFKGNALTWFSSKHESIGEWDDLVTSLKSAFLVRDYDYDFLDEIRNGTHKVDDKVLIYSANMVV